MIQGLALGRSTRSGESSCNCTTRRRRPRSAPSGLLSTHRTQNGRQARRREAHIATMRSLTDPWTTGAAAALADVDVCTLAWPGWCAELGAVLAGICKMLATCLPGWRLGAGCRATPRPRRRSRSSIPQCHASSHQSASPPPSPPTLGVAARSCQGRLLSTCLQTLRRCSHDTMRGAWRPTLPGGVALVRVMCF